MTSEYLFKVSYFLAKNLVLSLRFHATFENECSMHRQNTIVFRNYGALLHEGTEESSLTKQNRSTQSLKYDLKSSFYKSTNEYVYRATYLNYQYRRE